MDTIKADLVTHDKEDFINGLTNVVKFEASVTLTGVMTVEFDEEGQLKVSGFDGKWTDDQIGMKVTEEATKFVEERRRRDRQREIRQKLDEIKKKEDFLTLDCDNSLVVRKKLKLLNIIV